MDHSKTKAFCLAQMHCLHDIREPALRQKKGCFDAGCRVRHHQRDAQQRKPRQQTDTEPPAPQQVVRLEVSGVDFE